MSQSSLITLLFSANVLYFATSVFYCIVNFTRAFYEDSLTKWHWIYTFDVTLMFINLTLVINAFMFYYYYVLRKWTVRNLRNTTLRKVSIHSSPSSNKETNKDYTKLPASTPPFSSSNPKRPSLLKSLFMPAYLRTLEGSSEAFNVLGCTLYLFSSALPILTYYRFSVPDDHVLLQSRIDSLTYVIDNIAMLIFVTDSFAYYIVWRRARLRWLRKQNENLASSTYSPASTISPASTNSIKSTESVVPFQSPSRLSSENSPRISKCKAYVSDWMFWANLFNIFGGLLYLGTTIYGLFVRVKTSQDSDKAALIRTTANSTIDSLTESQAAKLVDLISTERGDDLTLWQRMLIDSNAIQSTILMIGDTFYLFCAAFMLCAFWQDYSCKFWRRENLDENYLSDSSEDELEEFAKGKKSKRLSVLDELLRRQSIISEGDEYNRESLLNDHKRSLSETSEHSGNELPTPPSHNFSSVYSSSERLLERKTPQQIQPNLAPISSTIHSFAKHQSYHGMSFSRLPELNLTISNLSSQEQKKDT